MQYGRAHLNVQANKQAVPVVPGVQTTTHWTAGEVKGVVVGRQDQGPPAAGPLASYVCPLFRWLPNTDGTARHANANANTTLGIGSLQLASRPSRTAGLIAPVIAE